MSSDQNNNSANLWQTATTQSKSNCLPHALAQTLHKTANQITVVSTRMKPIDMSCSKNENSCKARDSWKKSHKSGVPARVPSSVQSEIVPKLWNSKTSQNCHFTPISAWQLFHHSFCLSPRSYCRLPSLALPPDLVAIKKNLYIEGISIVLYFFCAQMIWWASLENLYSRFPHWSYSSDRIAPCQRYSLGLYFKRTPDSAFWR